MIERDLGAKESLFLAIWLLTRVKLGVDDRGVE